MNVMQFNAGQLNGQSLQQPLLAEGMPVMPNMPNQVQTDGQNFANRALTRDFTAQLNADLAAIQNLLVDVVKNAEKTQVLSPNNLESVDDESQTEALTQVIGDPHQSLLSYLLEGTPPAKVEASLQRVAMPLPAIAAEQQGGINLPEGTANSARLHDATVMAQVISNEPNKGLSEVQSVLQAQAKLQVQPPAQTIRGTSSQGTKELAILPPFFAKALLAPEDKTISNQGRINPFSTMLTDKIPQPEGSDYTRLTTVLQSNLATTEANDKAISWSPIKLKGNQQEMAQQLHAVLKDRLQIQTDNRIQQATIRLDPPALGKIEISLHLDAGKLNVQINSNQSDVHRALQQMSSELRQQLTEQNFVQVNVQVTSQHSQQGGGQQRRQYVEEHIIGAQEIVNADPTVKHDDSILTTI